MKKQCFIYFQMFRFFIKKMWYFNTMILKKIILRTFNAFKQINMFYEYFIEILVSNTTFHNFFFFFEAERIVIQKKTVKSNVKEENKIIIL